VLTVAKWWMMAGAGVSGRRLRGGAEEADGGQHGGGQATAEPRVRSGFPLR